MTPDKFKGAVSALGLSQRRTAAILGYDERTIRRWLRGENRIPIAVQSLLTLMVYLEAAPEDMASVVRARGTVSGLLEALAL